MATRCLSWRGHRYEERYDEIPMPTDFTKVEVEGIRASGFRELMIRRVYIHDICVRCGDVIMRKREDRES